ncbi:MAG: hypothetical protein IT233_11530 [Bacteroidia bacterium]|nr:hypothetical protein [Bacteroidia bacterium]
MRHFVFLLLLIPPFLHAQFDSKDFENLKFRNIGPAGMSGRITAIDADLNNPSRIFVGSASGGVWYTENGGATWTPVFDEQSTQAIGSIRIHPNNPSEIWVGTGEGNPRNSMNMGNGIYCSKDGGKTWKCMGLEKTKTIHRIIIHRDEPNTIFAAVTGSPWGPQEERGVFKTTDGGKTWRKILYVNNLTGAADMISDPQNPNKLIVAMWEHKREPWFFRSGGKGSGIHISYDSGESWSRVSEEDGLPKGDLGRIGLAVAPSSPNIIYALVEAKENGLYKSTDGGKKWTLVSTKNIGNRPFYYAELYVDPSNENRLYNVYTYLSLSEDGGRSFRIIPDNNTIHPDHHALWIHPNDPQYIINGNDGGLNISRDRGLTWSFAGNIPVGQFYHVNVDYDFPYHVYGGLQDNGSWVGPSSVLREGGISNHDFSEVFFGDGFDVVPYSKDNRYGYAMSQGGNLAYYDRKTGRFIALKPAVPPDNTPLRFNWNAGIAADPFNSEGIYFGSQFLHYSDNKGLGWTILSPDLTTNDTSKQNAHKSGGLTLDATNAENYCTILCIAPSPADRNVIWVGTDDGNLQLTTDRGKTWKNLAKILPGAPPGAWIPQIEVSAKNPNEAFVVLNNYRKNDFSAYCYHTTDQGKTWKRIADPKDIGSFVLSIVQDPVEPNLLFLGTDCGLYVSFNKGATWKHWNKGFPQVQVNDMKIHAREGDLVIATFGRALWILDDLGPLRKIAGEGEQILQKDILVMGYSDAHLVNYNDFSFGIRFTANNNFSGENHRLNQVHAFVWKKKTDPKNMRDKKSPEQLKDDKNADKKLKVNIYDLQGKLVRNFSRELKDGINQISWSCDINSERFPSRQESKPDEDPRGVFSVLPGKYKMVFVKDKWRDSVTVEVKEDPFTTVSTEERMKTQELFKKQMSYIRTAAESFSKLRKARESIALVEKLLSQRKDTLGKEVEKMHNVLTKQLDSLEALFLPKEDIKGIQRNPKELNAILGTAGYYLDASWGIPGPNAMIAIENAGIKTTEITAKVDLWLKTDWHAYRKKVEGLKLSVFSD